ncbi:hypothetical protein Afil01_20230 [Actinorhabdospora filicis]|uniref:Uncharacterized protein n=1 Tax=Actinorhabdospora filicis TaxID=1785913 RepID=A0A9W6SMB9_9ACTN|nr:hypothetical protein [Actinorhabdospora filicis]GLZ77216.1 hypothetical protein Afil01_20230 [Actinorhabdospora filicis]
MAPPSASGDNPFDVHVDRIVAFQPTFERLDARVVTAHNQVSPASAQGLGSFPQAQTIITEHTRLLAELLARLAELKAAIAAANTKTTMLIENYRKAESANQTSVEALMGPLLNVISAVTRKD